MQVLLFVSLIQFSTLRPITSTNHSIMFNPSDAETKILRENQVNTMAAAALASPVHQQPWYWLYSINTSIPLIRKDLQYLHHFSIKKWQKWKYVFFLNLASQDLITSNDHYKVYKNPPNQNFSLRFITSVTCSGLHNTTCSNIQGLQSPSPSLII